MKRMVTITLATVIALVCGAVSMAPAGTRYAGYGPGWGPNLNTHIGNSGLPANSQGSRISSKHVHTSSLHRTGASRSDVKQGGKFGQSAAGKLSKSDFSNAKMKTDGLAKKLAGIKKADLLNSKIGKLDVGKLSKSDFSKSKMKIDGLAKKLTDSKKSDLMNTKLASADKLKSLNLQKSVGLSGAKPSDGTKSKMSTATVPSGEIPDNPKGNATGHSQQISPDGTTRTDTWTLPDGSKLEETFTRANQNGPWIPTNQYNLTRPDGTQYTYSGNNAGNPLGPWATKITPDNPGPVPGNGGNDPAGGAVAGIPGGNGGGFDPGTVIGPIVAGITGGGMVGPGSVGYEAPPIVYADPAPAPQPRYTVVSSQSYEPVQTCDIQKKMTEITGLIAQLAEKQKAVKDGIGDSSAVEKLVKTIVSKLEQAEECAGSNQQAKAMIGDLYKVVEQILA